MILPMLIKILLVLGVLIGAFSLFVASRPATFRIERSLAIGASPATLFPHLNDLKKAQVWSPWMNLDPAAKITFEGPPTGVGAASTWAGNNAIGEGRQTIVASRPDESVQLRLDFKKPFASTCTAEFTLKPDGGRTVVTWSMSGENNFFVKAVCLFLNQDKMIGGPFEEGLGNLRRLAESPPTD